MRKILTGLLIAVLMAACSSTPTKEQSGAKVEDRTPGTQPKPPAVVDAQPVTPAQVDPGTALAGDAALKDPNNILSKRIIYFDFDSNQVKEEFRPLVTAHAKYVSQNSKAKMIIQGNTDERGSREYNLALGQRRADAVKQMMSVLGAEGARVESVSFGEEKPRVQGSSESAYAENRRAEIVYQGE
ncbi:MAG TPA: peptidoglycan-associated lipoprotein Pal [Burkholderiales bacterium]|nr:peptidoglycan-associated lipoprotein Pal [Burkholderiales bacterium]